MSVTSYFPALGSTIAESIESPSKTGLALVIGLLITFYGAKGVADALQHALNHAWEVSRSRRAGFPKSLLRSFTIIFGAGFGLVGAASLTTYASGGSHNLIARSALWLAGFCVLFLMFWGVFVFGSSARKRPLGNIPGALFAAVGFTLLQSIGGYIMARHLRSQTGLNAQFAVVLGILFWLYLQAQVLMYAIELNTVRAYKLWPRSINPKPPLPADLKAYDLYRRRESFEDDEPIKYLSLIHI